MNFVWVVKVVVMGKYARPFQMVLTRMFRCTEYRNKPSVMSYTSLNFQLTPVDVNKSNEIFRRLLSLLLIGFVNFLNEKLEICSGSNFSTTNCLHKSLFVECVPKHQSINFKCRSVSCVFRANTCFCQKTPSNFHLNLVSIENIFCIF